MPLSIPLLGSSPPARGSGRLALSWRQWAWFIPACAGIGHAQRQLYHFIAVHPRLRGDRGLANSPVVRNSGSSPPARGSGKCITLKIVITWFIPACAGIGWPVMRQVLPAAVHPRLRGDRREGWMPICSEIGSSPPARGSVRPETPSTHRCRFIPACAGIGLANDGRVGAIAVHPRLRGDRGEEVVRFDPYSGSSPPARGSGHRWCL